VTGGDRLCCTRIELVLVSATVVSHVGQDVDDHGHVVADVVHLTDCPGEPIDALEDGRAPGSEVPRQAGELVDLVTGLGAETLGSASSRSRRTCTARVGGSAPP